METERGCAAHVPEHTLDQPEMALAGIMHVQEDLLDDICDLRTRDRQVLKGAGDAAVTVPTKPSSGL